MIARSLGISQIGQILQQEHAYNRKEGWARKNYRLDLQQKGIDIINTVREEMRDQVRLIISSIESLIVVATLLLTTGFCFACEGTFPDSEIGGAQYPGLEQWALTAYSTLLALSQVFPLGALVLMLATRAEAELCFQDISYELNDYINRVLRWVNREPDAPDRDPGRLDADEDEFSNFQHDAKMVSELAKGMLHRVSSFHYLFPLAQLLVFCGLLSAVMTCSVMLGIIFCKRFPSAPWAWRCYSGIVTLSAVGCLIFVFCMRRRLRRPAIAAAAAGAAAPELRRDLGGDLRGGSGGGGAVEREGLQEPLLGRPVGPRGGATSIPGRLAACPGKSAVAPPVATML
mmetsp:Transcript_81916/g.265390  ORF Transcript_81916/g.265390 Transcript_81916/m.265390 type:complete len:344 (+) Transcript_81916:89-1120(+)